MSQKIFIVIAAYNEERRVGHVVRDLKTHNYHNVIVVDDHSSDNTSSIAKAAGAHVIRHKKNLGQGGALRSGINQALKEDADIILTFDGDGQHRAADIKKMVKPIIDGNVDVTLGSRFLGGAPGLPWYKWITLKGSVWVERVLLGIRLTDAHNGLRALSKKAATYIKITMNGMAHASEIISEIQDFGLRYEEIPVTIQYDAYSREKGQSIFNAFKILHQLLKLKIDRKRRAQTIMNS